MAMTEDLSAFFSTADFASDAQLAGVAVRGIFDKAYQFDNAGGAGFASSQPAITLPSAGLPADPVGLTLLISGVSYTVVEHRPDGTGVSILLLELAA